MQRLRLQSQLRQWRSSRAGLEKINKDQTPDSLFQLDSGGVLRIDDVKNRVGNAVGIGGGPK
jgi:hypothetical protein